MLETIVERSALKNPIIIGMNKTIEVVEKVSKRLGWNFEYRIESLLRTAVDNQNGNRVRHLALILAEEYKNKPNALMRVITSDYDSYSDELFKGLCTSAYYAITGDMKPMFGEKYGGLGATLTYSDDSKKYIFNEDQFRFARTSYFILECSSTIWGTNKQMVVEHELDESEKGYKLDKLRSQLRKKYPTIGFELVSKFDTSERTIRRYNEHTKVIKRNYHW